MRPIAPVRRVVAVVQARMGSSRLPGKALMPLAGRPVIWHVLERLARAQRLDQVVLATTTAAADDALADYVTGLGVVVVRGSERNVLARFIQAAELTRADVVVRITGDCPLVDPWLVDYLVDALAADAGYVQVNPDGVLIDEGIDPCTTWALHRLAAQAGDDPVAQEHVTSYFKLHPGFVPVARCPAPEDRRLEGARISVDTPADLRFLERIYERMQAAPGDLDVVALVGLLRAEPELMTLNRHVVRKQTRVDDRCVLIRCDGYAAIGLGHVVRCLAIAEALRDRHGLRVVLAVDQGRPAQDLVARQGFKLAEARCDGECEAAWIDRTLAATGAEALVLDIRTDLPADTVRRWRQRGTVTAVVDDGSPRRLAADLAFFPPVPQLKDLDWSGFSGALFVGWDYLALRREFARTRRALPAGDGRRLRLLVTMGGSDPAGATAVAIEALAGLAADVAVTVVVGAASLERDRIAALVVTHLPGGRLLYGSDDMPALMAAADLAVIAFGMTAYEAAAVGTPTLALCLSADHEASARALADEGALVVAGRIGVVTAAGLAPQIAALIANRDRLAAMGEAGGRLIDGRGADRIADRIMARLAQRERGPLVAA
ncbi:MAG: cytidylyltransferase domain-containing protein [Alphaproteobacteria bacterium]